MTRTSMTLHPIRRKLMIKRVSARLFESPRHSGAIDEGVTPRLLRRRVPGTREDERPAKSFYWASLGPLDAPTWESLHGWKPKTCRRRLARLVNLLCNLRQTP